MRAEYLRHLELGALWAYDSGRPLDREFPEFDPYEHRTWCEDGVLAIVARPQALGPVRLVIVTGEPDAEADLLYVLGTGRIDVPSGLLCVRFTDAIFPDEDAPSVGLELAPGQYTWTAAGDHDGQDSSSVLLTLTGSTEAPMVQGA